MKLSLDKFRRYILVILAFVILGLVAAVFLIRNLTGQVSFHDQSPNREVTFQPGFSLREFSEREPELAPLAQKNVQVFIVEEEQLYKNVEMNEAGETVSISSYGIVNDSLLLQVDATWAANKTQTDIAAEYQYILYQALYRLAYEASVTNKTNMPLFQEVKTQQEFYANKALEHMDATQEQSPLFSVQ